MELLLHRNSCLAGGLRKWQAHQCRHTGHVHTQAQISPHLRKYDAKAQPHKFAPRHRYPPSETHTYSHRYRPSPSTSTHRYPETPRDLYPYTHKEAHTCTCARTHIPRLICIQYIHLHRLPRTTHAWRQGGCLHKPIETKILRT